MIDSSQEFNIELVRDLARERVVLFLGAGVSMSGAFVGGGHIHGWDNFLREAAGSADASVKNDVFKLIEQKDYLMAAELLKESMAERWQEIVSDEFSKKAEPSELLRGIINLKQKIIVTTNFDKILENSFPLVDTDSPNYPEIIIGAERKVFRSLKDQKRTYIIKMHGTVDDPRSMVFTRSEYIRSAFGNDVYNKFLENLLLNYTFLFIGFSMNDPAILSLMEMYALNFPEARPHYIFAPGDLSESIISINKRLRKLTYICYDPSNDHAELVDKIRRLGADATGERQNMIAEWWDRSHAR